MLLLLKVCLFDLTGQQSYQPYAAAIVHQLSSASALDQLLPLERDLAKRAWQWNRIPDTAPAAGQAGELFDFLNIRGRLHEDAARRFFQQLITGIEACHAAGAGPRARAGI